MSAGTIQIRAALLAVIALGVIVGFSPARAGAASSFECPQNSYSSCFEQASVQAAQVTAVKKLRHQVAKKHHSKQCPSANPYYNFIYCR
jgi:hypothetical protein